MKKRLTMSSAEDDELSDASSSAGSEWGQEDPGMGMTGVHLTVLGGRSVWPLAFHELMAAEDRREFVEERLAGADFVPDRLGRWGAAFRERVVSGGAVNWAREDLPQGEADRVLAALGLYHVRVRCVIPEELGGEYGREVSALADVKESRHLLTFFILRGTDVVVGNGRDVVRAVRAAPVCGVFRRQCHGAIPGRD